MNRTLVLLITGFLVGSCAFWAGYGYRVGHNETPIELSCPEQQQPYCPEPYCPTPVCERDVVNCQNLDYFEMAKVCLVTQKDKSQLQTIAENNAKEHNYEFGVYDCEQFSKQLIQRLNDAGYKTEYCVGNANLKGAMEKHAWVKTSVFIEATTGEIISPLDFNKNYQIEKCE